MARSGEDRLLKASVAPSASPAPLLGVDLGGSKIEVALLDALGQVTARQRVSTPGAYAHILAAIRDACDSLELSAGLPKRSLRLGIGTPGSKSPASGRMRNCNTTALNGRLLEADLRAVSGRELRLANDADCFALSEAVDGAGASASTVFGVILGTGVGGGLCVDGALRSGPNRVTGEWGHNRLALERVPSLPSTLLRQSRRCYCGRQDCIETWLSGPGLAQTHLDLHGKPLDIARLRSGELDQTLEATLETYLQLLAAGLAGVINILDPEIVVLGGGLCNITALYDGRLHSAIAAQVFSDQVSTPVVAARHGDSSGVRGAAWLWRDAAQTSPAGS